MTAFAHMNEQELKDELSRQQERYEQFKAKGLALNMARGKPSSEQLDLSMPMLGMLDSNSSMFDEAGTDLRNYGNLTGINEAKKLMAAFLDDDPECIIVGGNSSLTMMYDTIARCVLFGTGGYEPWGALPEVKWLCPVPGYDRHFSVVEAFGFTMIPVPLGEDGPDMNIVEELVANDAAIKGIWCVPKYANPSGISYSDEVVDRLASMTCAAPDFRIFWDNAYAVHHLYNDASQQDSVKDIAQACISAGSPNRYFKFASTSKVTFPGAGIAAMATSADNIAETLEQMNAQAIGPDKINQLRHVLFLCDADGIAAHMSKHAELIRPKFELVLNKLAEELGNADIATWTNPRGGYFISFDGPEGTAKRIVTLAKDAGVIMTSAGATWPHGEDPNDSNIRIAPTLPPLEELEAALDVFCCCVKIAAVEKLLADAQES